MVGFFPTYRIAHVSAHLLSAGSLTPGRPVSTWPANRRVKAASVSQTTPCVHCVHGGRRS